MVYAIAIAESPTMLSLPHVETWVTSGVKVTKGEYYIVGLDDVTGDVCKVDFLDWDQEYVIVDLKKVFGGWQIPKYNIKIDRSDMMRVNDKRDLLIPKAFLESAVGETIIPAYPDTEPFSDWYKGLISREGVRKQNDLEARADDFDLSAFTNKPKQKNEDAIPWPDNMSAREVEIANDVIATMEDDAGAKRLSSVLVKLYNKMPDVVAGLPVYAMLESVEKAL